MALVLSAQSNDSPFVKNEVNLAFSRGKAILTVRLADFEPSDALAFYLARHQWTDGFPPPLQERIRRLGDAIHALNASSAGDAAAVVPSSGQAVPPSGVLPAGRARTKGRLVMLLSALACLLLSAAGIFLWSPQILEYWQGGKRKANDPSDLDAKKPDTIKTKEPASASEIFMQTYFDLNQLRLIRCESSPFNCTNGVPGPTDQVDFPKLKRALAEILAVAFYTTVDRVVIGEFTECKGEGEFFGNVTILDGNLAKKNLYGGLHLGISQRQLEITLFTADGKTYVLKDIDSLNWDLLRIKNGLRSYLEASVPGANEELFVGELEKRYEGSLYLQFAYKKAK